MAFYAYHPVEPQFTDFNSVGVEVALAPYVHAPLTDWMTTTFAKLSERHAVSEPRSSEDIIPASDFIINRGTHLIYRFQAQCSAAELDMDDFIRSLKWFTVYKFDKNKILSIARIFFDNNIWVCYPVVLVDKVEVVDDMVIIDLAVATKAYMKAREATSSGEITIWDKLD